MFAYWKANKRSIYIVSRYGMRNSQYICHANSQIRKKIHEYICVCCVLSLFRSIKCFSPFHYYKAATANSQIESKKAKRPACGNFLKASPSELSIKQEIRTAWSLTIHIYIYIYISSRAGLIRLSSAFENLRLSQRIRISLAETFKIIHISDLFVHVKPMIPSIRHHQHRSYRPKKKNRVRH